MASTERYVPEELCFQVFLNLPVKSLLRFKCVCKSWNNIFSSKSFSYSYLAYKKSSLNTKKYLLFEHDDFYSAKIIDATHGSCYNIETANHIGCYRPKLSETGLERSGSCSLKVYGICDGLLCLSDGGRLHLKSTIYLWNPIARRGKKIPESHVSKIDGVEHSLVFGYHDDDYKIIKIVRYGDFYCVCIYSLIADAWKFLSFDLLDNNIPNNEFYDRYMQYPNAMLVNGVAYFLKEEPCQVLRFDMSYEMIQAVDFPAHFKADSSFTMMAYGESVGLLEYCVSGISTDLVMWILSSHSDSGKFTWEKNFSVSLEDKYPLGFLDGKFMVRACDSNKIMLFNLETRRFTELKFRQQFETSEVWETALGIDSFVESLVLLDEKTMNGSYIVKECCSANLQIKGKRECCSANSTAFTLQKWKI